jgi:hypothetical protein
MGHTGYNRNSPLSHFDKIFSSDSPVPSTDEVTVTVTLTGVDASAFMVEASSRGIGYDQFAEILLKQGMFFWAKRA